MTLGLHNLSKPAGARRSKRIGRGNASGHGTYATRGQKGQRARTGGSQGIRRRAIKQLISHLPKSRGFKSLATKPAALDIKVLKVFADGFLVTPERLVLEKLLAPGQKVKFIGNAPLDRKLTVKAHGFSAGARQCIIQAGGTVEPIPQRKRRGPRRRS